MRSNLVRSLVPLAAVLLLAACSARGTDANLTRFDRSVGVGTATDIQDRVMKVLRLHQFVIEREQDPPNIYIETRWRNRRPFEDEQHLGITAAQIRAIVRTSSRSSTPQGQLFNVNLRIETRVQLPGSSDWSSEIATPQYQEYVEVIFEDLRRELEIGVRTFGGG
jgi:hypothetical protein